MQFYRDKVAPQWGAYISKEGGTALMLNDGSKQNHEALHVVS